MNDSASSPAPAVRLQPFGLKDWHHAQAMLARGFDHAATQFWEAARQRFQQVPPSTLDAPLGVLLVDAKGPQGICLLLASQRPGEVAAPMRVNASSWAIDPRARRWAGWMCREGLKPLEHVYTVLTPITATQRIIQRAGFRAISHQRVRAATFRLARVAPTAGVRLLNEQATLQELRASPMAPVLQDHARLGCIVCSVETAEGLSPLVLVPQRRQRVLPAAEVVYCESQKTLRAALPQLGRHLLGLGKVLLEFEANEDMDFDVPCTRLFRRRFARGPYDTQGIDHLYSEQVYIHR